MLARLLVFSFLMLTGSEAAWAETKSGCDLKSMQLSRLDIAADDTGYLEAIMGFSYGPEVKQYIHLLNSAKSYFYYRTSKHDPLFTFFSTDYKDQAAAQKAFKHLKKKWDGSPDNDVVVNGTEVVFFGNNRLPQECFAEVIAIEKTRLLKK